MATREQKVEFKKQNFFGWIYFLKNHTLDSSLKKKVKRYMKEFFFVECDGKLVTYIYIYIYI